MSTWSLTYQQSVFKRYHSDKYFSEFLPTRWRQKSTRKKITSLSLYVYWPLRHAANHVGVRWRSSRVGADLWAWRCRIPWRRAVRRPASAHSCAASRTRSSCSPTGTRTSPSAPCPGLPSSSRRTPPGCGPWSSTSARTSGSSTSVYSRQTAAHAQHEHAAECHQGSVVGLCVCVLTTSTTVSLAKSPKQVEMTFWVGRLGPTWITNAKGHM